VLLIAEIVMFDSCVGNADPCSQSQFGITVSLLHTGRHYADELSADGVLYHYPRRVGRPDVTGRRLVPQGRRPTSPAGVCGHTGSYRF
jgi:hypothetical protein